MNILGDAVVVTGIAGPLRGARNVKEFSGNCKSLSDFEDFPDFNKFDAGFFSISYEQAVLLDPQTRIMLELAYEAILDAGVSPQSLKESRTGVFVALDVKKSDSCLANRISKSLDVCGPSMVLDTTCLSSAAAIDCAYQYIKSGEVSCDFVVKSF
jgi:fatty acid synthase